MADAAGGGRAAGGDAAARGRVYIGWDPDELIACNTAASSIRRLSPTADIYPLHLSQLQAKGWYTRKIDYLDGRMWDVVSAAPMSTQHAIGRFFVPLMQRYQGWAVFLDGDVLLRTPIEELLVLADPRYAVQVVQHPSMYYGWTDMKKDGATQTMYRRKNWSSVMLLNCAHPAHQALTLERLNWTPGRDLHAFCWLEDHLIGALPAGWNYLVDQTFPLPDPIHLAHFTLGIPTLPGYQHVPFADEWRTAARQAGYRVVEPEPAPPIPV